MVVIVFGVAGVGKTTIGKLLSSELGWKFYEGDDFHPIANVEKMKKGIPLNDGDRQPWLESLRERIKESLAANEDAVLACSALKRKYRDLLRVNSQVRFVYLRGDKEIVRERLKQRRGHFFDPKLLESQFADLEEPGPDEAVLVVDAEGHPQQLVTKIVRSLRDSRQ